MKSNSIAGINLWYECDNNCTFCLQNHVKEHITLEQKKNRINNLKQFICNDSIHNRVNIMGGEIFQGQLKGCEKEWFEMVEVINNSNYNQYVINTNLIGEMYLLDETISYLKKDFLIATSYDTFGRFHSVQDKNSWVENVNKYVNKGYKISCTCVITDEFTQDDLQCVPVDKIYVTLYEPQQDPFWIREHYVDNKEDFVPSAESRGFYLNKPKRIKYIKWANRNKKIISNYVQYDDVHPDDIYYVTDEKVEPVVEDRISNFSNPKCGHPITCLCYEDSDKCIMCDSLQVLGY